MDKVLNIHNLDEAYYYLNKELERRQNIFWTMKNGQKINIQEMDDNHLQNTLSLIERLKDEQEIIYQGIDN